MDGLRATMNCVKDAAHGNEGLIRISAGGAVGRRVLIPLLAEFSKIHPGVTFDLVLEDRATDVVADRIDLGFKAGNAPTVQVVSRRLFQIQLLVCASPAYLEDHSTPTRIDDLSNHRCIGYRQPGTGLD
jgi:DNA-binding transcriptional LysR family regulator